MSEEKIGKSSVSEGKSRKYKLTIGERLKDARVDFNKHKKQTIKEVSDATGIPQSTLSEIENDKREPGAGIIKKLAEHYGVSSDFLLGLSDIRTDDIDEFMKNTDDMPEEFLDLLSEGEPREKVVCDYVGAMTDRFAISMYEKIYIPKSWIL